MPVPANGTTACSTTDPVGSLIDNDHRNAAHRVHRIAGNCDSDHRRQLPDAEPAVLPLVHRLRDQGHAASPAPARAATGSTTQSPGPPRSCDIYWVTGDHINGPMYTQDQFWSRPATRPHSVAPELRTPSPAKSRRTAPTNLRQQPAATAPRRPIRSPTPTPQVDAAGRQLATSPLTRAKHGIVFTGTTTLQVSGSRRWATTARTPRSRTAPAYRSI